MKQSLRIDTRAVSQLTALAILLGSAFVLAVALGVFMLTEGAL